MREGEESGRPLGLTYAVSDTGPLISAFQSGSFALLADLFAEVHTPTACVDELEQHGWADEMRAAAPTLVHMALTEDEQKRAEAFARQIAERPESSVRVSVEHQGEAQAIVLALRPAYRQGVLLVDERAARSVALASGLTISGFPGVLLLAAQVGLLTPEDVRARLETCRRQGTHYGVRFIEQVYQLARRGRRA